MKKITFVAFAAAIAIAFASCSFAPNFDAAAPEGGYFDSYITGESGDQFEEFTDNPFISTSEEPISTFSVDADGACPVLKKVYTYNNKNVSKIKIKYYV